MTSGYVVICTDMPQFRIDVPAITDPESPTRGNLEALSGAHTVYSPDGNSSMKLLSDTTGFDALAALPYITVTSYEEIFGTKAVLDDEDNEIEPAVPGYTDLLALYKSVWDYETPYVDEDGNNHYKPKLFVTFGPETVRHIA